MQRKKRAAHGWLRVSGVAALLSHLCTSLSVGNRDRRKNLTTTFRFKRGGLGGLKGLYQSYY